MPSGTKSRGAIETRLQRAFDIVHDRRAEPVSLDFLAGEVGLSKFHLLRTFEARFGVTPHRLQTLLKVTAAKEALARRDVAVTDLCLELGYESLGSFSTWFKSHVGVSPVQYRRSVRTLILMPQLGCAQVGVPQCFAQIFSGTLQIAISEK